MVDDVSKREWIVSRTPLAIIRKPLLISPKGHRDTYNVKLIKKHLIQPPAAATRSPENKHTDAQQCRPGRRKTINTNIFYCTMSLHEVRRLQKTQKIEQLGVNNSNNIALLQKNLQHRCHGIGYILTK